MLAVTAGNPPGPASSAKPSMLSSRPRTSICLPLTRTSRFTSRMNRSMSKNEPLKTKENGIVGNPAAPTVAPGGRVAADAWVAGADVPLVAPGVEAEDALLDDEDEEELLLDDEEPLLDEDVPPVDVVPLALAAALAALAAGAEAAGP